MVRRFTSCVLAAAVSLALTTAPDGHFQPTPPRIVAVGDIHGSEDGLNAILSAAGLIDGNGRWAGGVTHLVQTGDYLDRGSKVREVLDILMRLEDEAKRAGGRADILMGNHEAMNLLHDFRDVSPETFAAFADDRSEERRQRAYKDYVDIMKRRGISAVPEAEWNNEHPPGFVEYVDAIGPRGRYGKWLRGRKVVVLDGDTIFMHAGLTESTTGSLQDVNQNVARQMESWDETCDMLVRANLILPFFTLTETLSAVVSELKRIAAAAAAKEPVGEHVTREFVASLQAAAQIGRSPLMDADGPLWSRGFALWPDTDQPKVVGLLQRFGAKRFVTGHTPIVRGITPRFEDRIFLIDTGMLASYFEGGRPSAIEIAGDNVTAIYTDTREVLTRTGAK